MCDDVTRVFSMKRIFQFLFLFYTIRTVQTKSVKKYDECDQFLISNDCYYFPCLDAHYSCGRNSYLVRFSHDLCTLPNKKFTANLTTNALLYFNQTNSCVMKVLNNQLVEEKISEKFTCGHLHVMIYNIYLNCFQNNQQENTQVKTIDLCSVICENLQAMINLFLTLNESHFNLQLLLLATGKSCGANIHESILNTIPSLLTAICLDRKNARLEGDITDIMFNARFRPADFDWT
ncbi:unnamed protein product [Rotaria magnacalcarata]|uniref:Uncharacterized protein n=1 Tax=Rotaria magnacalcarata TaxID=392030 RepID=A0A816Y5F8_9BILA|nr:unnamed protein product [Rotaria magnacalcarata]CAF1556802.1 unnamed protein product [Rotaria magnacalcarata]CAF2051640.1 unnamed protein product [Rotaria magnacalcarata]CAF2154432.1 unnamed protein product [Rotaria magnacalcarata]CAF2169000.1 unnamed protein product [Rotaria magnacalcarata]